jgi:hypothetical protein
VPPGVRSLARVLLARVLLELMLVLLLAWP